MANTTFNVNYATSNVTLTNSDLTATITDTNGGVAISPDAYATGKYYFEVTIDNLDSDPGLGIGIADTGSKFSLSGPVSGIVCFVANNNADIYANGVDTTVSLGSALTEADVLCIAVDIDNKLAWFRKGASGDWNGSPTANPATGAEGISYTTSNPISPFINFGNTSGLQVTANFGDSAFTGSAPAGFTSTWTAYYTFPSPSSTFSPFLRTSNVVLSNGNLTATVLDTNGGIAIPFNAYSSGRYYFEVTIDAGVEDGNFAIGVGDPTSTWDFSGPQYGAVCFVYWGNSKVFANQTGTAVDLGSLFANGDTICVAVDITSGLIYFRKNAGGTWNNISADPVVGTGGVSFTFPFTLSPIVNFGNTANEQVTANFGATAFVGAVPSGYSPGWTATPPAPSTTYMKSATLEAEAWIQPTPNMVAVTLEAEAWIQPAPPNMNVLQTGAETWIEPSPPNMKTAQFGTEVWATVAGASITMYTTTVAEELWINADSTNSDARISTVAPEVWYETQSPSARISSVFIELWRSSNVMPTQANITTVAPETWYKASDPNVDVTTVSSEVWLVQPSPSAQATSVSSEIWLQDYSSNLLVTQAHADVFTSVPSKVKASQATLEVWASSDTVPTDTKMRATYLQSNVITSNITSSMYATQGAIDVISSNIPSHMNATTVGVDILATRPSHMNATTVGGELWVKTAISDMRVTTTKLNVMSDGGVPDMKITLVGTNVWATPYDRPETAMRATDVIANVWATSRGEAPTIMYSTTVNACVWATVEDHDPTAMYSTHVGVTVWAKTGAQYRPPSNPILLFGL